MNKSCFLCILTAVFALLASCGGGNTAASLLGGDTLRLDYAEHLQMVRHANYTVVRLSDPWQEGCTLHTYLLVGDSLKTLPADMPEGTVVRTPLRGVVVATSAHCALMNDLQAGTSLVGVCDVGYINLPWIKKLLADGKIVDCGSGLEPMLEKIIDLSPDAIFLSPFQNSGGYGRLEKLGMPIVELADYMETSALGRAEWMKFYGMLFGREQRASELFDEVVGSYESYKRLAAQSRLRPRVMMDTMTGSVWYMPGGRSTLGRLLADANVDYVYAADGSSGSMPLPLESVVEHCTDCDLWMLRYGNSKRPMTLADLAAQKQDYTRFKPYTTGEVYGCNTLTTTFYEETSFHPDRLLRDIVFIAHPDLDAAKGETRFFKRIIDEN